MKTITFLLALVPFAFTGPAQPVRRYFPEEDNPDFKRYIHIEKPNGEYELIDLRATDGENIAPRVAVSDVEYNLYTPKNQASPFLITNNDVNSLSKSYFDPNRVSMFVVHGWNNNRNSDVNVLIRQAIFDGKHDLNVFVVDWSGPANEFYTSAKSAAVPIGQIVGNFIKSIKTTYGLDGSSFVLVGHSLGAHVVGSAGATLGGDVANIIGMDPAGPLYTLKDLAARLDTTDGAVVQIIHTNGDLLGFASSIGDIDYFPNGGMSQPGCGWDLAGTCAHGKSYRYLAEALSKGPVFRALLCPNYSNFQKGQCANNALSIMGELKVSTRTSGDYFLDTNSDAPYARG